MPMTNTEIEEIELKYLDKIYYFLKYVEDEMLTGFESKEKIREDWMPFYGDGTGGGTSEFAVGAERIVYALLNGRAFGTPNSNPVSSDMFFEVSDAYIHLDMKTVMTSNIGDYKTSIFIGSNQNSYSSYVTVNKGRENEERRDYNPSLPKYYSLNTINEKICLSYFITILTNSENANVEMISLLCMPNGQLQSHYLDRPLMAGKNPDNKKIRFRFENAYQFELLENTPKRVRVSYYNPAMLQKEKSSLKFYFEKIID